MGMELPFDKGEWVELVLKHIENGQMRERKRRIRVNALSLYDSEITMQELMEENKIRIPEEQELLEAEYEGEIPVSPVSWF